MEVYQNREDSRRLLQASSVCDSGHQGLSSTLGRKFSISRRLRRQTVGLCVGGRSCSCSSNTPKMRRQVRYMAQRIYSKFTRKRRFSHLHWDAVVAGMKHLPDSNTLKDIFMTKIRKTKRMEYHSVPTEDPNSRNRSPGASGRKQCASIFRRMASAGSQQMPIPTCQRSIVVIVLELKVNQSEQQFQQGIFPYPVVMSKRTGKRNFEDSMPFL